MQILDIASSLYGFTCVSASREDLLLLEQFQRKVLKWITGVKNASYVNQLHPLFVLPLPMFIQLRDILTMTKIAAVEDAAPISQMIGDMVEDQPEALFFTKHTLKKQKDIHFSYVLCFKSPEQRHRSQKLDGTENLKYQLDVGVFQKTLQKGCLQMANFL